MAGDLLAFLECRAGREFTGLQVLLEELVACKFAPSTSRPSDTLSFALAAEPAKPEVELSGLLVEAAGLLYEGFSLPISQETQRLRNCSRPKYSWGEWGLAIRDC